ncbi:MAG TPA: DUF309 domain-containing protein [Gemmataceae bacterium]|nr:DUF309 domain-containing protein [Gemmataceae bacterium]
MSGSPDTRSPTPTTPGEYDPRYLAGVRLFNAGEYFEAHEVWEDLWRDCPAADRRFYQSLIQAAVALYHWENGNRPGTVRLFHSGRRYMEAYRPSYRGLDVDRFWTQVAAALAPALAESDVSPSPPAEVRNNSVLGTQYSVPDRPQIALDPEPGTWPDDLGVRHE